MKFLTFMNEVNRMPVLESRIDSTNMREFVVVADQIVPVHEVLQSFFGENFKAPGEEPSDEDKRRAAKFGGIRTEQTLYYREEEGYNNCAMFWPWTDGTRYTVKIARNRLE